MKKVIIPVFGAIGATVIVIAGATNFIKTDREASSLESRLPSSAKTEVSNQAAPSSNPVDQVNSPGLVSINYNLHHLPRLASNQLAIWIEDEQGSLVKTLFATSFTANGGYVTRPESLPEWRQAADWKNASRDVINRVSRPEQKEGNHSVYWDCTNESGKPVQPGTYVYKIEGNIEWSNRVVYSGKIVIGSNKNTAAASAAYFPKSAEEKGVLVEQVTASFLPGETIDPAKMEVTTQTRGS